MNKTIAQAYLILLITIPTANADVITLAADTWCPINCEAHSHREGFMVHIARVIFSKAGHSVEYKVMPWSRTLAEVKEGNIHGAIGAYHEDCPDCIFPKHEQASIALELFTKKQNSWRYEGVTSLKNVSLAVIADYAYGEDLDNYIKANKNNRDKIQVVYGNDPLKRNIKKLASHRVGAVIETREVFWYLANKLNLGKEFSSAGIASQEKKSYIAFSPAVEKSQTYANILSAGMKELRASGELKKILSIYGLSDWK